MTQYRRKAEDIQALRVEGQKSLQDYPDWITGYKLPVPDIYGNHTVGLSTTHEITIPYPSGAEKVIRGQWIVLEGGKLSVYTNEAFETLFEVIPVEPEKENTPDEDQ